MEELDKVKKGLECLARKQEPMANPCSKCDYHERPNFAFCVVDVATDALELMKEDCHNCKLECLLQKYDELKEKYDALLKEQKEKMEHLNNITLEYEKEVFRLQTLLKEKEAVEPSTDHHLFICPACKTTLKREQKFCHECGKRIEWKGRK